MRSTFRLFCINRLDRSPLHNCWSLCDFSVEFAENSYSKIDLLYRRYGESLTPLNVDTKSCLLCVSLMRGVGDLCLTELCKKSKNLSHYNVSLKLEKTPALDAKPGSLFSISKIMVGTSSQGSSEGWRKINWIRDWDHLLVPGRRAHLAWQPSGSALLSPSPASCTSVHILPSNLWNQPPTTRRIFYHVLRIRIYSAVLDTDPYCACKSGSRSMEIDKS